MKSTEPLADELHNALFSLASTRIYSFSFFLRFLPSARSFTLARADEVFYFFFTKRQLTKYVISLSYWGAVWARDRHTFLFSLLSRRNFRSISAASRDMSTSSRARARFDRRLHWIALLNVEGKWKISCDSLFFFTMFLCFPHIRAKLPQKKAKLMKLIISLSIFDEHTVTMCMDACLNSHPTQWLSRKLKNI